MQIDAATIENRLEIPKKKKHTKKKLGIKLSYDPAIPLLETPRKP